MSTRRPGFTMVEVLVATVLGALIMAAIYSTLVVQQKAARQISTVTNTQQTVRTGMQVLESELREIGGRAGDITEAAADHVTFRAMRKVAFLCAITSAGATSGTIDVFAVGDQAFKVGDTLIIHADRNTPTPVDDTEAFALITSTGSSGSVGCNGGALVLPPWPSMNVQPLSFNITYLNGTNLSLVSAGSVIRSTRTVTYGLYPKGSEYVLGVRNSNADSVVTLIGPLAPTGGLALQYFDTLNNAISPSMLAAQLGTIGRLRVSVVGKTKGAAKVGTTYSDTLTSDVAVRGN